MVNDAADMVNGWLISPCGYVGILVARDEPAGFGRAPARRSRPTHCCHRPRRRAIQYSETVVGQPIAGGVLDAPPARGMTATCGASACPLLLHLARIHLDGGVEHLGRERRRDVER